MIWYSKDLPELPQQVIEDQKAEAARLKERLSQIPWYAKKAERAAANGVDFWRRLAAGYNTAHLN